MDKNRQTKPNYSVLAHIYDTLMDDVDYEVWADYLDELIQTHAPETERILELACGTGSLALSLDEMGYYSITATDKSPKMIDRAKRKAVRLLSTVRFETVDFLKIDLEETYDLVCMVFDSINYLHSEAEILDLLGQVQSVLKPAGHFIFDFTTPRNSRKAIQYLHKEEGVSPDNYRFFRKSHYDARENIHTNEFEIEKLSEDRTSVSESFMEVHKQKIYTLPEMNRILEKSGFRLVEAYNGFNMKKADKKSLRITMVCQW